MARMGVLWFSKLSADRISVSDCSGTTLPGQEGDWAVAGQGQE